VRGSKTTFEVSLLEVLRAGVATLAALLVTNVVAEPSGLTTPVGGLVGLPCVGTTTGKTESLETHGLESDVTGEKEEIGPRDLVAVLLLDGPQETTSLVEVTVVWPRVERSESLLTLTSTTATILDTVGTGRVPCHADEETTVVTEICWPPVLGVGHEVGEVLLESIVVDALECGSIVKLSVEWVGGRLVLAKDVETELVRPPIRILGTTACDGDTLAVNVDVGNWALSHFARLER